MKDRYVVAIVGSYREGGVIDQATAAVLAAAAGEGARTRVFRLREEDIAFCRNCRSCTQAPGPARGRCLIEDAMGPILDEIEAAEALVLAAPVNAGDVTAITRRFLERMVCCTYWPWGAPAPKPRIEKPTRPAVLITSSAMPGPMARLFTRAMATLAKMAGLLGARPVGRLYVGLAAQTPEPVLPEAAARRAAALGRRLMSAAR